MRRIGQIILTIFLIAILTGVWIVFDNWNTIIAVVDSFRYTQEELEIQMVETKAELQNYLDENDEIVVRDLTEEEQNALNEGQISGDQAILILTGQSTLEEEIEKVQSGEVVLENPTVPPAEQPTVTEPAAVGTEDTTTDSKITSGKTTDTKPTNKDVGKTTGGNKTTVKETGKTTGKNKTETNSGGKTSGNKTGTTQTTTSNGKNEPSKNTGSTTQTGTTQTSGTSSGTSNVSTDQKISEYVAQLYVYKNEFLNRLGGLESTISDEFYSLPKAERNTENKERIISSYMGQVGQWEKECDSKVYTVLGQLEETLVAADRDVGIVSKIEENYLNEKRLKKAYYMDIYSK